MNEIRGQKPGHNAILVKTFRVSPIVSGTDRHCIRYHRLLLNKSGSFHVLKTSYIKARGDLDARNRE